MCGVGGKGWELSSEGTKDKDINLYKQRNKPDSTSGSFILLETICVGGTQVERRILNSVEEDVNVYVQHPQRLLHVLGPCRGKAHAPGWRCSVVAQSHPTSAAPADQSLPRRPRGHSL